MDIPPKKGVPDHDGMLDINFQMYLFIFAFVGDNDIIMPKTYKVREGSKVTVILALESRGILPLPWNLGQADLTRLAFDCRGFDNAAESTSNHAPTESISLKLKLNQLNSKRRISNLNVLPVNVSDLNPASALDSAVS